MEEILNQLSAAFSNSEIGQWISQHAGWFILALPFVYVIICSIISRTSEKKIFFYSYLDVFITLMPAIVFIILSLVNAYSIEDPKAPLPDSVYWSVSMSAVLAAIFSWIFSLRANQGSFFTALFMFIGKIMYFFIFWAILVAALLASFYTLILASKFKRKKYQHKKTHFKNQAKFGAAPAAGGMALLCAITTFGCKNHNLSVPPKVTKQVELVESEEQE